MGALGFWAFGWALAYGVDHTNADNVNGFCGTGEWFLIEGYDYSMWMFQFSFAATAATIDSGAVAERMNFKPYVFYSFVMTAFIQPIATHWCWSASGWLTQMGFHDFAGSGPVHLVGGASALVAAWPRTGRFAKENVVGKLVVNVVQGENLPQADQNTHPYVVVQQVNHGAKELRTRAAESSRDPRWGATITMDVMRELGEEEEMRHELEIEADLSVRWGHSADDDSAQEYHGPYRLHPDSSGRRSADSASKSRFPPISPDNSLSSKASLGSEKVPLNENPGFDRSAGRVTAKENRLEISDAGGVSASASFVLKRGASLLAVGAAGDQRKQTLRKGFSPCHLALDPRGWLLLTDTDSTALGHARSKSDKIKLKHLDRVERFSGGRPGFTIFFQDLRQLEVDVETDEQRQAWMTRIQKVWRPTISPQKLHFLCIDEDRDVKIGQADFAINAGTVADPEKFAMHVVLPLDQGGRIELNLGYTSSRRLQREIFQACDPVKLLFGMFVLWVNWYSFNVGSTNQVSGGGAETAGRAAVVTTLGTAAGAMVSMLISDLTHGFIEPEALTTGILGALVSITAPCAVVTEAEGALIGALGAVLAIYANLWEIKIGVDDPCSAFAIHGACGIWGVVSVGLFAQPEPCMDSALRMADGSQLKGLLRGGGFSLLGVQTLAALAITVWAMSTCLLTLSSFNLLSKTAWFRWLVLRPTKAAEELGFDQTEHNIRRQTQEAPTQTVEVPKLKENSKWRKLQGLDAKSLRSLKNIKAAPQRVPGGEQTSPPSAAEEGKPGSEAGAGVAAGGSPGTTTMVPPDEKPNGEACALQSQEFGPMSSGEIAEGLGAVKKTLTPTVEEEEEEEEEAVKLEEPATPRSSAAAAAVLARLEHHMASRHRQVADLSAGSPTEHGASKAAGYTVETVSSSML